MSLLGLLDPFGHLCDKYVLSSYNKPDSMLGAGGGGSTEKREDGKQDTIFSSRIWSYRHVSRVWWESHSSVLRVAGEEFQKEVTTKLRQVFDRQSAWDLGMPVWGRCVQEIEINTCRSTEYRRRELQLVPYCCNERKMCQGLRPEGQGHEGHYGPCLWLRILSKHILKETTEWEWLDLMFSLERSLWQN